MGFIDKLKNMFTEEVEVEEEKPIKKDVIQVEIPAPSRVQRQTPEPIKHDPILEDIKRQEIKKTSVETTPKTIQPKNEEKFVFPVFFDDDDFKNIDEEKNKHDKVVEKKENREVKNPYNGSYKSNENKKNIKSEVKKFTPTPIISPIYGVLDKNYHKEDITSKNDHIAQQEKFDEFSIDSIRKKAYGTLEDDLENNMYAGSSKFLEEKKQVTADMFNDMDSVDKEEYIKHEKIEVVRKVPSRSEKRKNKIEEEDNLIAEEMDKNYEIRDNNNDSDLLNLIDSMYDKNGG